MDFVLLAFYVFSAVAVMSAAAVVSVRNPVHSVLFLVLSFFTVACTWILADAEFMAVALVLVYVGAVMVLFLFVLMMLDIDLAPMREGFVRYLPVGMIVAIVMLVEILTLIGVRARSASGFGPDPAAAVGDSNTEWVAHRLFTDFLLPFEIAALILTVAVVAAVTLTLRRRPGTKHQNPGQQVRVRAADRVRLVSMQAGETRSTKGPAPDGPAPQAEDKA